LGSIQGDFFWKWGGGIGRGYVVGYLNGESFHVGRDIAMKGTFLKKYQKLNKKISFSTESKEQHQNLKRTENITYMIAFAP
jgi:hypothetical protein